MYKKTFLIISLILLSSCSVRINEEGIDQVYINFTSTGLNLTNNSITYYNGFELCNTDTCQGGNASGNVTNYYNSTINNFYNEDNSTIINTTITEYNSSYTIIESIYDIKNKTIEILEINTTRTQIIKNDTLQGYTSRCIDINSAGNITFIGAC